MNIIMIGSPNEERQFSIVLRKQSLRNLFPTELRKMGIHESLRWVAQYPFGYKVFVLRDLEVGDIGYCAICRGVVYDIHLAKKTKS